MARLRQPGTERAGSAAELMPLPSTDNLRCTWDRLVAGRSSVTAAPSGRLHACFDFRIGLSVLARTTILRNVFKTEIRRDYRKTDPRLSDASWQIGISNKTHAEELFSARSLGLDPSVWLRPSGENVAKLHDMNWRSELCAGFTAGAFKVGGLNQWFSARYARRLQGGHMTPHLLFETRFFGKSAIDNYIRFLLQGVYVTGANDTLSHSKPFSNEELLRDPARNKRLDKMLEQLTQDDNGGRPISIVSCEGNQTAASRFATTLVARLGDAQQSACYVPLSKIGSAGQLNDHGFRSIVEVLHRFVTGELSLECTTQEHDEAHLARMVRQVRSHLVRVPTVLVFDGFLPGAAAYPALVSFIRDEPIDRIVRLLQHPDTGDWISGAGENIAMFRKTHLVVVGAPPRRWMEMHRHLTIELPFTQSDQVEVLSRPNMKTLAASVDAAQLTRNGIIAATHGRAEGAKASVSRHAAGEWQLNALSFLARKGPMKGVGHPIADFDHALETAFKSYWQELTPWQRVYLRALALSESGLRWSTAGQIFDAYLRLASSGEDVTNEEDLKRRLVSEEEFRKFINDHCSSDSNAPLLFEYADGPEADNCDIFDFPSQAIGRLAEFHPWIIAWRRTQGQRLLVVDFCDSQVKQLVRQTITNNEALLIRRILAELCLQAYRVRLRHSRPARRMGRRAARHLAEGLMHGIMSVEHPVPKEQGVRKPVLPLLTLGEIPAEPQAAFSFLYTAIFKELFSDGDLTGIARYHGNGELLLEMLFLMSGSVPVADGRRAADQLPTSVRIPPWFEAAGRTDEGLRHLLAIAQSAKRASRVEVLTAALNRIREIDKERRLTGLDRLAFRKLDVDRGLLSHGGSMNDFRAGTRLREEAVLAVVAVVHPGRGVNDQELCARELSGVLQGLNREVRAYVREHLNLQFEPAALEGMVDATCLSILRLLPARKLPQQALTVLTRMAWIEGMAGELAQRRGEGQSAIARHITAIGLYWLGKALALHLRKQSPLALPPRVGFSAAEGYLRSTTRLMNLLASRDAERHMEFRNRLMKSARNMLDTYTREQGVEKADHIAVQVLECTYARSLTPPSYKLARLLRPDLPTGDERLTALSRCLQWLRGAEIEMLSFSGQPSMRVMLCRERVLCIVDMLNRVSEHLNTSGKVVPRRIDAGDGNAFRPLVDTLINDLRQLSNFITFLKGYSPAALFLIDDWTRDLSELLSGAQASIARWKAREPGAYNEALKLLGELSFEPGPTRVDEPSSKGLEDSNHRMLH